ncbi:YciI family protein [Xanthobacter sp. AM11]|uniref:YciI family protein n=1 Tax=Xanthobacter sp. AM11 TaxID=3380643 RepID=UPI0039BF69DA
MMYAILCYHEEDVVCAWSKAEDDAVMARLAVVHEGLVKAGKLGASVRLLPTTAATTLRKSQEPPLVIDGPFAETKEQLLGFYLMDAEDLDDVLAAARELAAANPGGCYEIRPVGMFFPDQRSGRERTGA